MKTVHAKRKPAKRKLKARKAASGEFTPLTSGWAPQMPPSNTKPKKRGR